MLRIARGCGEEGVNPRYILVMDECMKKICQKEDRKKTLAYVDDVAVVTESAEDC